MEQALFVAEKYPQDYNIPHCRVSLLSSVGKLPAQQRFVSLEAKAQRSLKLWRFQGLVKHFLSGSNDYWITQVGPHSLESAINTAHRTECIFPASVRLHSVHDDLQKQTRQVGLDIHKSSWWNNCLLVTSTPLTTGWTKPANWLGTISWKRSPVSAKHRTLSKTCRTISSWLGRARYSTVIYIYHCACYKNLHRCSCVWQCWCIKSQISSPLPESGSHAGSGASHSSSSMHEPFTFKKPTWQEQE